MKEKYQHGEINIEKYIVRIIEPNEEDLNLVDQLKEVLKNNNSEEICSLVKAIVNFLSASIVIDRFKDHSERRKFINSLSNEQAKIFLNNRLRVNVFFPILQIIDHYELFYDDEKFKKKFEELFKLAKNYNNLLLKGKLKFISKLRELCFDIYKKIIAYQH